MEKRRLDNFWIGALGGLILPFISIFIYWLWSYRFMHFIPFIKFLLMGRVLSAVASLCLVPNLGLFFLFYNYRYDRPARGMILAMLLYGFFIVYLKIWVEHSWES